jgi:transposase
MAAETISMIKLKQIFLLHQNGESYRNIARVVGISKNTVKKYIRTAQLKGNLARDLALKEDYELEKLFAEPAIESRDRNLDILLFLPYMEKALKETGVDRWHLWGEYKNQYPDGYAYSQFCYYYRWWQSQKSASGHFEHLPGEKAFMDFTGKKLFVVDRDSGEVIPKEVYISLLGYSGLTYVEALHSQQKEEFIKATENSLHYFGGVPKALVPDNLKSAVTRADKYEAELNISFADFANHYNVAVVPARPARPRDKPIVENMVRIIYTRIFAPLRNRTFFSLAELNAAIAELLELHNNQKLQKEPLSRREKFAQSEAHLLSPLPVGRYHIKHYKKATVMKNCHIQLEKHYYSVPYRYIGKLVNAVYTISEVHIFLDQERIAVHPRGLKEFGYTTVPDHLPSSHRFVSDWTPEKFISWAERISPDVKAYISYILAQKIYPELAYKSCVGILSMEKKVGAQRLIRAVQRATYYQIYNYKAIKKIIDGGLDILFDQEQAAPVQASLPFHDNIRGKDHYQ